MFDTVCKSLAERIDAKRAHGLVDIKFYVNRTGAEPAKIYEEAGELFAAIEDPDRVEDFSFNDRHAPMVAA